jgi:putative membrane protein insertion efficiency factor
MASTGLTATVAAALVRGYQLCLSGLKPACCRFQPSCSEYARQAILSFGLVRGTRLAILRLLRCHPFYRGPVYDPVPATRRPAHAAPPTREPGKPMIS